MERAGTGGDGRSAGERRRWTLAIFAYVALEGAGLQFRGAVLPVLRDAMAVPAWQLGMVAPAGTVGFLVLVALVGAVAGRVGTHRLLFVGVVASGLPLVAMGLAPTFGIFLLGLAVRGVGSGVGRGSDRPLLSHLYPARRGRLFGYYDMMWAVGATAGPLVVSAALRLGDWRLAYFALAAAYLPVAALVWALPAPGVRGGDDPLDLAEVRRLGTSPAVAGMAAGLFLVTGVEGGLFTWLTTYAEGQLTGPAVTASLSVLLAAYIPGRFAAGRLAERVGSLPLAVGLAASCLLAVAYTFVLARGPWLLVGLFAVGLALSGLFPTLTAYATDAVPEHSAPVNAVSLVVAATGIAGVPAAMGFVVGGAGVGTAMRLLLVPLGALVVVTGALAVRERVTAGR